MMASSQQQWRGDGVMQTAAIAGQTVIALTDDAGRFAVHYLGFMAGGIASMDDAKASASVFAKKVLAYMAGLIQ